MLSQIRLCGLLNFCLIVALGISSQVLAQKQKVVPEGTAVLWQEPTDLESRNLYWGPGGEAMKPDLSSITFIKDETGSGYSKKYRVKDAQGRIWVAKLSKEGQPETAANRLIWAVGYPTEISYLVPQVTIEGKGSFQNVKFEGRPEGIKRLDFWTWDSNPFVGKPEFQGLKVIMVLFNNWDIKDDNNKILLVKNAAGENELHHIISDLGATFGKTGSFVSRSRNEPEDYVKAKFINQVKGDRVTFHYGGKRQDLFRDISIEHVRWAATLLSRLSEQQVSDAFRAANYTPEEVKMLTQAFRNRVAELVKVGNSSVRSGD